MKKYLPKYSFQDCKGLIISFCIFSLFIFGWSLRTNLNVTPVSPSGGDRALQTLAHGSYPDFIYKNPSLKYYPYRHDPLYTEYSSSLENFIKIFFARFKENPTQYITWYIFKKPYYLWSWSILQGSNDIHIYEVNNSLYDTWPIAGIIKEFMKKLHPLLLICSILGLVIVIRQKSNAGLTVSFAGWPPTVLYIIMLYVTLLYSVFAPWPRYSIPYRPILYITAIWGIILTIKELKVLDRTRDKKNANTDLC